MCAPSTGPHRSGTELRGRHARGSSPDCPVPTWKSSSANREPAATAAGGSTGPVRATLPTGCSADHECVLRPPPGSGLGPGGCRSQAPGPDGGRWVEASRLRSPPLPEAPGECPGWAGLLTRPGEVQFTTVECPEQGDGCPGHTLTHPLCARPLEDQSLWLVTQRPA